MERELLLSVTLTLGMRESSVVSVAAKLWTGRSRVRFLVGERDFFSSSERPDQFQGLPSPIQWVPGVKLLHVKVRSDGAFRLPPLYAFMAVRENCVFFFVTLPFFSDTRWR
jgi:hypothetical protein